MDGIHAPALGNLRHSLKPISKGNPAWYDGKREVHIHPSSVNSAIKTFQYPFLVFLEKVGSMQIFLPCAVSTLASDRHMSLLDKSVNSLLYFPFYISLSLSYNSFANKFLPFIIPFGMGFLFHLPRTVWTGLSATLCFSLYWLPSNFHMLRSKLTEFSYETQQLSPPILFCFLVVPLVFSIR